VRSGLITDAVAELVEAGVVTGARKSQVMTRRAQGLLMMAISASTLARAPRVLPRASVAASSPGFWLALASVVPSNPLAWLSCGSGALIVLY
jgi:hypothetical protein